MSATLLEGLIVLVLLVVAWQIGLILAPVILRELRGFGHSLDEVSDEVLSDNDSEQQTTKER